MDFDISVKALSACDQMEAGLRMGDPDTIRDIREMVKYWLGDGLGSVEGSFGKAFKCLLRQCSEGTLQDLSLVMMAVRCLAETELAEATGGTDEDDSAGGEGGGPTVHDRAA